MFFVSSNFTSLSSSLLPSFFSFNSLSSPRVKKVTKKSSRLNLFTSLSSHQEKKVTKKTSRLHLLLYLHSSHQEKNEDLKYEESEYKEE